MGTTTNFTFPYPEPADPPDVPKDIKALADALDTFLLARPKTWGGVVNASFDANGNYTWTHNLGWTPAAISAHAEVAAGFTSPITIHVRSDSNLTTEVIFRALTPSGNFTQPVKLFVVAVA